MSDVKLRYQAFKSFDEVESAVLKGIESASTMRARVQYAAIALMIGSTFEDEDGAEKTHAQKAVELAQTLVTQLGQGVKAEGLVKYLRDHCGFRLDAEGKQFVSVKNAEWIRANLEAAKAVHWWKYAPATPFKGFVLSEELRGIIKKAKRAMDEATKDEAKAAKISVDTDMITVLEALLGGNPVPTEGAVHLIEKITPHVEDAPEEGESREAPVAATA